MANRQTTFLLKRSNVPGKIPSSSGLTLGELALNTADAILYTSGTTANDILPIGWDRIHRTGDTVTGNFNFFGDVQISGSSQPGGYALSVTGDTNLNGDLYAQGDLFYNGSVIITGGTVIQSGLTANTIYTDYIDFNTGATVTQSPGRIYWDSGTGTLNVTVGDSGTGLIDLQVGQEEIVRVYNSEATTLLKGEIVYVSGSQGNRPAVKRAQAQADLYSVTTLGMVDRNISSGDEGYVTTFGIISNLNTLGLTGGTPVWLSPTVPGGYTSTKPQAPEHIVLIGYVVRVSATVGSIFINISNGCELYELHDVRISAATEGDLLVRSTYSGSPVWVNTKTLNGNYNINGTLSATTIGASGNCVTDLYISNIHSCSPLNINPLDEGNVYFGSTSGVTVDVINSRLGIGTSSPSQKLHISGNAGTVIYEGTNHVFQQYYPQGISNGRFGYIGYAASGSTDLRIQSEKPGGLLYLGTEGNITMTFSGSNVGVNIAPTAKFHINNTSSFNSFLVEDDTNPDSTPFVIDSIGRVGIGTTNPGEKVSIIDGSQFIWGSGNTNTGLRLQYGLGTSFWVNTPSGGTMSIGGIGTSAPSSGVINITSTGNVGINTTTPSEKLQVSGNTIVSGTISGGTMVITTQPTSGYTTTQILMRNSTTGQVEITDRTSPSIYNYGMTYVMTTFNYLT
jgi:hypothetical protein